MLLKPAIGPALMALRPARQPAEAIAREVSRPAGATAQRVGIRQTARVVWQKHRMAMSMPPGTATFTKRTPTVAGPRTPAVVGKTLPDPPLPPARPVGTKTGRAWSPHRNRAT